MVIFPLKIVDFPIKTVDLSIVLCVFTKGRPVLAAPQTSALAWDREGVNSWALKLGCATGGSKSGSKHGITMVYHTQRIHGAGIFTYIDP